MGQSTGNNKTAIIVALISLLGVIGAALINRLVNSSEHSNFDNKTNNESSLIVPNSKEFTEKNLLGKWNSNYICKGFNHMIKISTTHKYYEDNFIKESKVTLKQRDDKNILIQLNFDLRRTGNWKVHNNDLVSEYIDANTKVSSVLYNDREIDNKIMKSLDFTFIDDSIAKHTITDEKVIEFSENYIKLKVSKFLFAEDDKFDCPETTELFRIN